MTEKYYLSDTSRYTILESKINNNEKEKRNLDKRNECSNKLDRDNTGRDFLRF